ncbi:hypothetical protein [Nitrosomonas sp. Nm33]|nr:hypothetical protein [Nitrosomonas sp. Nm33]
MAGLVEVAVGDIGVFECGYPDSFFGWLDRFSRVNWCVSHGIRRRLT